MKPEPARIRSEWVAVGEASALKAQTRVAACQNCSPSVSRSFGSVLLESLGEIRETPEFFLSVPTFCPSCGELLLEDTLVRCDNERLAAAAAGSPAFEQTSLEEKNVILLDEATLRDAQAFITGCGRCAPHAEMTFEYILDAITEDDPTVTEYVMCRPVACPECGGEVSEKTLVVAGH